MSYTESAFKNTAELMEHSGLFGAEMKIAFQLDTTGGLFILLMLYLKKSAPK